MSDNREPTPARELASDPVDPAEEQILPLRATVQRHRRAGYIRCSDALGDDGANSFSVSTDVNLVLALGLKSKFVGSFQTLKDDASQSGRAFMCVPSDGNRAQAKSIWPETPKCLTLRAGPMWPDREPDRPRWHGTAQTSFRQPSIMKAIVRFCGCANRRRRVRQNKGLLRAGPDSDQTNLASLPST